MKIPIKKPLSKIKSSFLRSISKKKSFNKLTIILSLFVILNIPAELNKTNFPVYRVVIDPGHGGISLQPKSKHGDRFDQLSGKYLNYFGEGTRYKNITEHEIVYSIALKVKAILDLCLPNGNFNEFANILKKYTDENITKIEITTILSRGELHKEDRSKTDDPNADFRLFDYPDKNGNMQPGRISRINAFKPHLVVSLHCDFLAPIHYRGINPVIVPPYSLLRDGLDYLKGLNKDKKFFWDSAYCDWFAETVKRTSFRWFLNDVSLYFAGYPLDKTLKVIKEKFEGYKYNMVSWKYKDEPNWEVYARNHYAYTQYAGSPLLFLQRGKFWEREKSKYEYYRRDHGPEGFGGDNLYASRELIKFILHNINSKTQVQKLGNPYISVWSVPLLVNAISAYIELGYLSQSKDRLVLTKRQDEVAEAIAAGIYSLFAGIELKNNESPDKPKGKRIDFDKYVMPDNESYFDTVK